MPQTSLLGSTDIIAFVPTRSAAQAKKFYGETLGLRLISEDPFAVAFDAHGIMLRVSIVQELTPAKYTVLGWQVTDLAAAVRELLKQGIVFERFPGMEQDEMAIWTSPVGAKIAWFKDPDGNTLSLTEFPA